MYIIICIYNFMDAYIPYLLKTNNQMIILMTPIARMAHTTPITIPMIIPVLSSQEPTR